MPFMNTSLTGLIQARSPQFSKGQRRIAAFITQHYDEAAFMTAARLGYRTNQRETIEKLTQENTQMRQEIELLKRRLRALGEKI